MNKRQISTTLVIILISFIIWYFTPCFIIEGKYSLQNPNWDGFKTIKFKDGVCSIDGNIKGEYSIHYFMRTVIVDEGNGSFPHMMNVRWNKIYYSYFKHGLEEYKKQ